MNNPLVPASPRGIVEYIYQELDAKRIAGLGFEKLTDAELKDLLDDLIGLTEIARAKAAG